MNKILIFFTNPVLSFGNGSTNKILIWLLRTTAICLILNSILKLCLSLLLNHLSRIFHYIHSKRMYKVCSGSCQCKYTHAQGKAHLWPLPLNSCARSTSVRQRSINHPFLYQEFSVRILQLSILISLICILLIQLILIVTLIHVFDK